MKALGVYVNQCIAETLKSGIPFRFQSAALPQSRKIVSLTYPTRAALTPGPSPKGRGEYFRPRPFLEVSGEDCRHSSFGFSLSLSSLSHFALSRLPR